MKRRVLRIAWILWVCCVLFGSPASSLAEKDPKPDTPVSEGLERLLGDLRQREAELTQKQRELAERERSVAEVESVVEKRIDELEAIRKTVEERVAHWEKQTGDRVAQLASVYGRMPANRAAPLLRDLDTDLATLVLAEMKEKVSAAILSAMPQGDALRLSKRFARPLASNEAAKR